MSCIPGFVSAAPLSKSITISGIVSDYVTRNPIESAVISTNVSGTSYKATTDSAGRYSLNISFNRKPALIILVANKRNYLPSVKLISSIQPGRSYTANFTMRDVTPPSRPVVTDDGEYLVASNSLHAKWLSEDSESGIKQYRYSVGTRAGSMDIVRWTSTGVNTEITLSSLNLNHGRTYYFNVRAINGVNLPSVVGSSDGITVNAHVPEITRIIPYSDTTLTVADEVTIEATAQDPDNDPIQYQFSIDGQVKQPFSSSNTYNYTVEPSTSNTHILKVEVRDDKNGLVSQDITYNIQNVVIDTTPPPAPTLTTNLQSSSLDSIEAQWLSEDPESGIIEYQYAIGTTPGGTDVVYWSTYGNNTQAYLSGLNLAKGSQYYLSVVAKNGAGLKSPVSTSPAITAQKEPYIKIYYPYQGAIIDKQGRIKGIAEGASQVTINGKSVVVNDDGTFTGPYLVPPGYAKRKNITSDNPDYIIMEYPGETTIIAQCAGEEDAVSFRYSALGVKKRYEDKTVIHTYTEGAPPSTETSISIAESWNYDKLTSAPFTGWGDESKDYRISYDGSIWHYEDTENPDTPPGYPRPDLRRPFELYKYYHFESNPLGSSTTEHTRTSDWYIHIPPSTDEQIKPLVLIFNDCVFLETNPSVTEPHSSGMGSYKINGQPLKKLYGNLDLFIAPTPPYENACYVVLTDYQPDSDLRLDVDTSFYSGSDMQQWFAFYSVDVLTIDAVREVPYGSGNYIPVNAIPIFQPDDGKGRGPSLELVNMPFLRLKFNEGPSNSQINTLETSMIVADETKTFNLIETSADSNIFTDPANGVTVKFDSLSQFDFNAQDELTCSVTSTFGNISNKLFNLKESASDSLYFNDIKAFVTVIFNNELLPYQQDTLTIQYENGMMASEEALTETSADSLIFSNEDSTFTVNLNNYQGALPDNLDITINNQDYLEISKAELKLPKVNDNPYVYTNEPTGEGSDLGPNNPLDEGQGVFRIRVDGLASGMPSGIVSPIPVNISTDLGSTSQELTYQGYQYGCYMTPLSVILPAGDTTTYEGINIFNSESGDDKLNIQLKDASGNTAAEVKDDIPKGAFVGIPTLSLLDEFCYTLSLLIQGTKDIPSTSQIAMLLDKSLGHTEPNFDFSLTTKEFLEELPNHSILYITSHGYAPNMIYRGIKLESTIEDEYSTTTVWPTVVFPRQVSDSMNNNSYKLVFINACLSGDEKTASNTDEFVSAFNTGKYMGWKIPSNPMAALNYSKAFFNKMNQIDRNTLKPYFIKVAVDELAGNKINYADNINCLGPKDDSIDLSP